MRFLPALAALIPLAAASYDASACNNFPALCNSTYDSIMYVGAHDVAFVRTAANSWSTAGNQYFNASVQLSAGVRLLQSQLHMDGSDVKLCHTTCSIFDGGLLKDWLSTIKTWLTDRPSEVVTILLVNDEKISPSTLGAIFADAGLDSLAYVPDGSGKWPTLQEMIDNNTQIVSFLSQAADTTSVPYLLPEFDHIFETDFEVTDPANYTCYATRPSAVAGKSGLSTAIADGMMGFMNRFLYETISATLSLYVVNDTYSATLNGDSGVGNLKDGIAECTKTWGKPGGYVLLDFTNVVCSPKPGPSLSDDAN
jgi:hypothetical protein